MLIILLLFFSTAIYIVRRFLGSSKTVHDGTVRPCDPAMYEELTSLAASNEAAKALLKLISEDGAGTWPPTVNHHHDSWPTALQPYKEIYHKMAHLLPVSTPYLHDDVNEARIKSFRLQFRRLLEDNVNIYEVENLLKSVEAGSWDQVSRETYNALYSCLSWSRHAYR